MCLAPSQVRRAAFGTDTGGATTLDALCLVCATVHARLEGVDEADGLTPVFQSVDVHGVFDGGSAPLAAAPVAACDCD